MVVNVKSDGKVVVNRRTLSTAELGELLKGMVQLNSEQAVVIRGDETGAYKNIVEVPECLQPGRGYECRIRDSEIVADGWGLVWPAGAWRRSLPEAVRSPRPSMRSGGPSR